VDWVLGDALVSVRFLERRTSFICFSGYVYQGVSEKCGLSTDINTTALNMTISEQYAGKSGADEHQLLVIAEVRRTLTYPKLH